MTKQISKSFNYQGNQGLYQFSNLSDISELQGLTGVKNLLRYFYIDSQAQGLIRGLTNIILKDVPFVQNLDNEDKEKLINKQIKKLIEDFEQWLMWYLFIGFAVGEKLFKIENGTFVSDGLNVLHPTTVYSITEEYVTQSIWGNDGGTFKIPRDKVVYDMFIKEDVPWGKGLGRACYRDLKLKDFYYKIAAIGWENTALGIPVAEIAQGVSEEVKDNIEAQLENLKGGEGAYMLFTQDQVKFYFAENTGFRGKTSELLNLIKHHDEQIARAMLMQFINLTATGSRALAESMIDFFLASIEKIRKTVFEHIENIIKYVAKINWGIDVSLIYPKVSQKDPNELVKTIATALQAGAISPDIETENYIRKILGLPEREIIGEQKHTEHIHNIKFSENSDIFNRKLKPYENEEILKLTDKEYKTIEEQVIQLINKYAGKKTTEILHKIREIKEKQGGKITDVKQLLKSYFANDKGFLEELKQIFEDGIKSGVNLANTEMNTQLEFKSLTQEVKNQIANKAMVTATSLDEGLKTSLVYNLLVDNIYTQDLNLIHQHLLNSVEKAAKRNVTQISGLFLNLGKQMVFEQITKDKLKQGKKLLVVRTAVLDRNTCESCKNLDGFVFGLSDPGASGYVPPAQCEGGHACRCTILAYKEEEA